VIRTSVIGLGNVLMGDDGFGPYAVRLLDATWEFSGNVSLEDLGTPGFDLVPHLAEADSLIVLDAIEARGLPGEVYVFDRDAVLSSAAALRLGPHESSLKDALLALELQGLGPADVVIVGVIPERVALGTTLSDVVRRAYPAAEAATLRQLERCGARPARRERPKDPDLWWERAPCMK
jgi:hydrogenase maturation protease